MLVLSPFKAVIYYRPVSVVNAHIFALNSYPALPQILLCWPYEKCCLEEGEVKGSLVFDFLYLVFPCRLCALAKRI